MQVSSQQCTTDYWSFSSSWFNKDFRFVRHTVDLETHFEICSPKIIVPRISMQRIEWFPHTFVPTNGYICKPFSLLLLFYASFLASLSCMRVGIGTPFWTAYLTYLYPVTTFYVQLPINFSALSKDFPAFTLITMIST